MSWHKRNLPNEGCTKHCGNKSAIDILRNSRKAKSKSKWKQKYGNRVTKEKSKYIGLHENQFSIEADSNIQRKDLEPRCRVHQHVDKINDRKSSSEAKETRYHLNIVPSDHYMAGLKYDGTSFHEPKSTNTYTKRHKSHKNIKYYNKVVVHKQTRSLAEESDNIKKINLGHVVTNKREKNLENTYINNISSIGAARTRLFLSDNYLQPDGFKLSNIPNRSLVIKYQREKQNADQENPRICNWKKYSINSLSQQSSHKISRLNHKTLIKSRLYNYNEYQQTREKKINDFTGHSGKKNLIKKNESMMPVKSTTMSSSQKMAQNEHKSMKYMNQESYNESRKAIKSTAAPRNKRYPVSRSKNDANQLNASPSERFHYSDNTQRTTDVQFQVIKLENNTTIDSNSVKYKLAQPSVQSTMDIHDFSCHDDNHTKISPVIHILKENMVCRKTEELQISDQQSPKNAMINEESITPLGIMNELKYISTLQLSKSSVPDANISVSAAACKDSRYITRLKTKLCKYPTKKRKYCKHSRNNICCNIARYLSRMITNETKYSTEEKDVITGSESQKIKTRENKKHAQRFNISSKMKNTHPESQVSVQQSCSAKNSLCSTNEHVNMKQIPKTQPANIKNVHGNKELVGDDFEDMTCSTPHQHLPYKIGDRYEFNEPPIHEILQESSLSNDATLCSDLPQFSVRLSTNTTSSGWTEISTIDAEDAVQKQRGKIEDLAVPPPASALPLPNQFTTAIASYITKGWKKYQGPLSASNVPSPELSWNFYSAIYDCQSPPPSMVPMPWFSPTHTTNTSPRSDKLCSAMSNTQNTISSIQTMLPDGNTPCHSCNLITKPWHNNILYFAPHEDHVSPRRDQKPRRKKNHIADKLLNMFRRKKPIERSPKQDESV